MATAQPIPEKNNLTDLANLAQLFLPKSGTQATGPSTTSTTQKTNLTPEAVQEIVNQALQGQGGIQSIANGERSAGLYGGSSATLLTNNLLSQIAAKTALAQAGTTTTTQNSGSTTTTKADPQINPLHAVAALGGYQLLQGLLGGAGVGSGNIGDFIKNAGSGIGSFLKNLIGGGSVNSPSNTDLTLPTDTGGAFGSTSLTDAVSGQPSGGLGDLSGLNTIPIETLLGGGNAFGSGTSLDPNFTGFSPLPQQEDPLPDEETPGP